MCRQQTEDSAHRRLGLQSAPLPAATSPAPPSPQRAYRPRVVVFSKSNLHRGHHVLRNPHGRSPADTAASQRGNWLQLQASPPPQSKHNDQANLQSFSCCRDHIDGLSACLLLLNFFFLFFPFCRPFVKDQTTHFEEVLTSTSICIDMPTFLPNTNWNA